MRVSISKSKNHEFIYIVKDFYNKGSRTTKIYEKLGKVEDLCMQRNMSRDQLILWAKDYAKDLTQKEHDDSLDKIIPLSPNKIIDLDLNRKFNCGYLLSSEI